jgi:large subunit ribosomal protein L3
MGAVTVSVKNIKVVEVRPEQNLLLVLGAIPGGENGLVMITKG